jgi:2-dehydro-3-deoxyphosphogluconate aldolase/(4S)-4-hydroxy-2-oxoglutarate aldolase
VKFFPAGINGGAKAIRALSAPFPQVGFVPTGGVGPGNLSEYLDVPSVVACGGSWLVDRKLVEAGAWGEVTRLSAEALEIAREAGR